MNKAIVAEITKTFPIEGADRIQIGIVLDQQVVIAKDWEVGMVGIYFQPDLQLSDEYCRHNNLYRDSDKNSIKLIKGFFDDNRKVRCQPFMQRRSEGFFTSLDSVDYCFPSSSSSPQKELKVGDTFEELNGFKICNKFLSEKTLKAIKQKNSGVRSKIKNETPMFHKHVDTAQYAYEKHKIKKGDLISIQSKRHGTSGRYSLTKVISHPKPTVLDKIEATAKNKVPRKIVKFIFNSSWYNSLYGEINLFLKRFFSRTSWQYVVGTRNVTLYPKDREKEGFHGSEAYRYMLLDIFKPHLREGLTLYVEIFGWANGKPIMSPQDVTKLKDKRYTKKYGKEIIYKYNVKKGFFGYHIYRITQTDEEGVSIDYTEPQLQKWCTEANLQSTVNVCEPFIFDGDFEKLDALVYNLTEREDVLTEDFTDPSHISEGIIIRVDRGTLTPLFLKNKAYAFKVLEGIAKENSEYADTEDAA